MGRVWGPVSLRQRAGIALAVWGIAFSVLAVAVAVRAGPTPVLSVDDATPVVGQTVHFDASQSAGLDEGPARIVAYRFEFGDGTSTPDGVSPYARHAYSDLGIHVASVTVRDARGLEATAIRAIDVRPSPSSTGPAPDLASAMAFTTPTQPREGDIVTLSITIANQGNGTADRATVDVTDGRPNGDTIRVGQTVLPQPLAPGGFVTVYSEPFVAVGVGNHTLTIVIGNVTPEEIFRGDNARSVRMTVVAAASAPPPPPARSFPIETALLIGGLGAAAIASLIGAALLLTRPRNSGPMGPLDPPPSEPPDRSPPPIWPP